MLILRDDHANGRLRSAVNKLLAHTSKSAAGLFGPAKIFRVPARKVEGRLSQKL